MAKKKAASKKIAAVREGTITAFVQPLILTGHHSADEVIRRVKAKFPKSAFKASHITWHRANLARQGIKVPDAVASGKLAKALGTSGAPAKKAKTKGGKKAATKARGKK